MSDKPGRLSKFWEELKRRKTARIIVVYAATAFIILQLTDILTPALLLPTWTTRLVTLLLIIGFPIAVIFSWVFDITPQGIKKTKSYTATKVQPLKPNEPVRRKLRTEDLVVAALLVVVIILAYPKIFGPMKSKATKDPDGKISIAVNTFDNLTGDTTFNSWKQGIPELLIYNLGTSQELTIQNSQTMFEVYQSIGQTNNASMAPSLSREAAVKLKAGNYITGNFQKTGNKIRIIAKLIDTNSDQLLWTGKVDGYIDVNYIDLVDSLSQQAKDFLEIKVLEKNITLDFREAFTKSARAYKKYIEGTQFFMSGDYNRAIESLQDAYTIDSAFTLAAFYIANANSIMASTYPDPKYADQAILWTQKAFEGKERLPEEYQHWVEMWRAYYITKNSNEVLDYCSLLEKSEIKSRYYWYDVAITYSSNFEMWDKAANNFRKIEMISSEWGEDWKFSEYYQNYGDACHQLGKHEEEALLYETGLKLFPDDIFLLYRQALCATSTGDTTRSVALIKKFIEKVKQQRASGSEIELGLGHLYQNANSANLAEQHFRRALFLDPYNADRMNTLAAFLINNDRDIIEGMTLVDNALKIYPKAAFFLWTKGNGYYKQGKYEEALDLLQQAKDNFISISPNIERDIQKVKDAINNQK